MTPKNAFNVFCQYDKMCFAQTPTVTLGWREGMRERERERWGEDKEECEKQTCLAKECSREKAGGQTTNGKEGEQSREC